MPLFPKKHSVTGAPSCLLSTLVVVRAPKGLNPSSAHLLAAPPVPGSDHQLISVHRHQGSLSVLHHHSAKDCHLLVIFSLSGYFVWKQSSPWICSILSADAWKLQIFRNIYIFLATCLFFHYILAGGSFYVQMVSDSILLLICQISVEEIGFFVALELEESWFLLVLLHFFSECSSSQKQFWW